MSPWLTLLLLWFAFAFSHMGLASVRFRPRLVGALGAQGYMGLYSVVALAIFVPIVSVYFDHKHGGPLLWYLGGTPGVQEFMYAAAAVAFALMVAGLVTPSPATMLSSSTEVRGVFRITRHPLFMGVAILGAVHLLVTPIHATDLVFFGGLTAFGLIGCHHQDRRKLASDGEDFRQFYDATAFLPGTRRGALRGVAEQPVPLLLGVALAAAVRYFHGSLFG